MTALLDRFFTRLPGEWAIARTISDRRFGPGRFEGVAIFAPRGDGALAYRESGELSFANWRGAAYRSWLYVQSRAGLHIFYPDGQTLLHRFEFEADAASARHLHLCGQDRYQAELRLGEEDAFTLRYGVEGPAKNYFLSTSYRRRKL